MRALPGLQDFLLSMSLGWMSPMPAPCLLCLPFTATYINNCIKICALGTGIPTALGGLCSLGYRIQPARRPTWPHILMDLAQKLHFEPDLRVVGKLVLPQSAAGHEGRGQGWHMFRLCPEVVEGPTLSHPTTLGRRVPWREQFWGRQSGWRNPCCKDPTCSPCIASSGLGAAGPRLAPYTSPPQGREAHPAGSSKASRRGGSAPAQAGRPSLAANKPPEIVYKQGKQTNPPRVSQPQQRGAAKLCCLWAGLPCPVMFDGSWWVSAARSDPGEVTGGDTVPALAPEHPGPCGIPGSPPQCCHIPPAGRRRKPSPFLCPR